MPIQIIDNFDLNTQKPIDNRMVVGPTPSFYHNKNDIPNKYPGLRIWELPGAELGGGVTNTTTNGLSYVYTGNPLNPWISENTTAIGGGAGTTLTVPYFASSNTILDTDLRYNLSDKNFGFSVDPDTGASSILNNIARVKVDGNVVISGKFVGNAGGLGNGITNINAFNISVGTMNIARLGGVSTPGWILTSDTINSASYKIPSSINVGSATQLQNARLIYGNTFNGTADVTGNLIFGTGSGKATMIYNQTVARTVTIPSLSGNRIFSFIDQAETITANKTFTAPVTMTYNGTNPSDPPSLTTEKLTVNDTLSVISSASFLGSVTVTHTNPSGGGTFQKLRITEGTNQWWVTFGLESGANNPARIRAGNSSAANPSYTWRGDENTGLFWPSAGVIGFTSDGVEKMRVSNSGVEISSDCVISDSLSIGTVGTTFKRITAGTVRIYAIGGTADVIRGTGFTVVANTSGATPVVTVTLTGTVGSDIIVISSMDGSVNYYKWSCASEKISSSSFKLVTAYDDMSGGSGPNGWTGTVNLSFICVCI